MRARSVRVNARTAQNQRAAEQSEDSRESFLVLRKDLWEDHRSLCQEWRFGVCDGLDEPTLSGLQSRLSTENAQSCENSSESHSLGLSVSRLRPATCLRIPLSLTCFSMRLLRPFWDSLAFQWYVAALLQAGRAEEAEAIWNEPSFRHCFCDFM